MTDPDVAIVSGAVCNVGVGVASWISVVRDTLGRRVLSLAGVGLGVAVGRSVGRGVLVGDDVFVDNGVNVGYSVAVACGSVAVGTGLCGGESV